MTMPRCSILISLKLDFVVNNASYWYGDEIYWYPAHQFNVVIPKLTVESPQVMRNYTNTNLFPDGMGYFETGSVNSSCV